MTDEKPPSIADKVRFWEEQDRINQALIPRVFEMREVLDRLEEETAALSREMSEIETRLVDRAREAGVAAAQGATRAMLGELVERQDGLQAELAAAQTRLEENVRREGHAFGVWRGVAIAALILAAIALALSLYLLLV